MEWIIELTRNEPTVGKVFCPAIAIAYVEQVVRGSQKRIQEREVRHNIPTRTNSIPYAVQTASTKGALDETPLSREQAAALLGYSVRTLNNLAVLQKGPRFYSTGKKVFYFKSDLIAWMKSLPQGGAIPDRTPKL